MNYTSPLAKGARKIKAVWTRRVEAIRVRQGGSGGVIAWCSWRKILSRLRFLRWALTVQALKGAAYAGGALAIQIIAARFFIR
ncbi:MULTISPECIES: hypothetical protein [Streptomyces]|uniref:hypothetical protein n=1 Tax=Streptomyces TaxID=1883 RepID=UPI001038A681|nr:MULTISPECIES: hypothetical protein [Streptomyces]MBT3077393.1 hypothetical protein [Streptomyces sp. COG21]MBT3082715.1 hypothetical protein [Streptomyces sp. COG20]MBT3087536.1 hypothetical protein [Streptomyces sp. CYG21]MBT3097432.1 hypothetical protein [Streptomyces sp. CBG30]MBT3104688.1 hypothetical protein [Streptomyces sp. COG19]